MLKHLLVCSTTLILTSSVYSQNQQIVQVPMICVGKMEMAQTLGEFEEEPMMTMVTVRELDSKPIEIKTVLFVNPKTRSWTLVEQIGDAYCALSAGAAIAPYYNK